MALLKVPGKGARCEIGLGIESGNVDVEPSIPPFPSLVMQGACGAEELAGAPLWPPHNRPSRSAAGTLGEARCTSGDECGGEQTGAGALPSPNSPSAPRGKPKWRWKQCGGMFLPFKLE